MFQKTMTWTRRLLMRVLLRRLRAKRARSSVRSAGCAVISSATVVMHRTRHLTQAALEHLESIIYDPFHPDKNGVERKAKAKGSDDQLSDQSAKLSILTKLSLIRHNLIRVGCALGFLVK